MTRHPFPRIGWVGPLSPPVIDEARARRAADALRPRGSSRRTTAIVGLLLLAFCAIWLHVPASTGSLPTRAAVAHGIHTPPIGSGVQEMRHMRSLMAGVVGVGAMAAGAAAQEAVQWRVEDGGNGHWYALVVPTGPSPSWQVARDNAVMLGGYLATLTTAAENAFAFSVSQVAGG